MELASSVYDLARRAELRGGECASSSNAIVDSNRTQGPITEELVFRCCSLAVYHLAGASKTPMIFMTPWLFGLGACTALQTWLFSHVSIAQRTLITPGTPTIGTGAPELQQSAHSSLRVRRPAARDLQALTILAVFQTAYTSLFGFHCAYLFLRTGSLLPPITAHIFCNIMGLPQYGEHIVRFPRHRRGQSSRRLL